MGADRPLKIIIVRDRESSGGGIVNYYRAVGPLLEVKVRYCEVGRPHKFYAGRRSGSRFTLLRLVVDWWALFWTILRFRPRLIHLNPSLDPPSNRSLLRDGVNLLIARACGRRVLVFWRGWDNVWLGQPEFPRGNRSLLSRIYRKAAAHVVLSQRFKDDLRRWGFTAPVSVETTVASDECLAPPGRGAAPASGRHRLLFLSRVEEAKGLYELLKAFRLVREEFPDCTLTIAGDGPGLEAVRREIEIGRIEGVEFTGFVSGSRKVECYREATLFCFLSYTEGMPNAVLEAMGMGLPVVASDAGGLRDILSDGVNGRVILCRPHASTRAKFEPREVADAITALLRNPQQMDAIGRRNAEFARERFSAPRVAARLTRIYEQVVEGSARHSCPVEETPPCA
jgi:glycosyltransferase involved in cell wall biosynthesis